MNFDNEDSSWIQRTLGKLEGYYYENLYSHYGWFGLDSDDYEYKPLDQTGETFADFIAAELVSKKIKSMTDDDAREFIFNSTAFSCVSIDWLKKSGKKKTHFDPHMKPLKRIQILLSQPYIKKQLSCSPKDIPKRYARMKFYHSKSCVL